MLRGAPVASVTECPLFEVELIAPRAEKHLQQQIFTPEDLEAKLVETPPGWFILLLEVAEERQPRNRMKKITALKCVILALTFCRRTGVALRYLKKHRKRVLAPRNTLKLHNTH